MYDKPYDSTEAKTASDGRFRLNPDDEVCDRGLIAYAPRADIGERGATGFWPQHAGYSAGNLLPGAGPI